jgi:hypothetical protein
MKEPGLFRALAGAFGLAAFGVPPPAPAVELSTVVSPIYQVGNGSQVRIGHTALASTNYNRLYAGGTYSAGCGVGEIPEATGGNFLSGENITGGVRLTVTVPQLHPAYINLTGFYLVSRGQTIHCVYNWTSKAEEGGFSVGVGGITFQTGNGRREVSGSQPFIMRNPGTPDDGDDGATCIP